MQLSAKANKIELIDSHCHLDFTEFDANRERLIEDCVDLGVTKIIVPGVSADTWQRTLTLCRDHASLYPALGLHPYFIKQHQTKHLATLDDQLRNDKSIIAVGEIGLDFYDKALLAQTREHQLEIFEQQLILAKEYELPVIIHNRKAHDVCIQLLAKYQLKGGIIHAFSGSIQQAQKYSKMGYLLGFGGLATWPRSRRLRTLLEQLKPSQIALETDAPDMKPFGVNSKHNSPEYLPLIGKEIAKIQDTSLAELALETNNSIQRLFNI
jgi:TatD DNase family protein